jgi:hypothetical protein
VSSTNVRGWPCTRASAHPTPFGDTVAVSKSNRASQHQRTHAMTGRNVAIPVVAKKRNRLRHRIRNIPQPSATPLSRSQPSQRPDPLEVHRVTSLSIARSRSRRSRRLRGGSVDDSVDPLDRFPHSIQTAGLRGSGAAGSFSTTPAAGGEAHHDHHDRAGTRCRCEATFGTSARSWTTMNAEASYSGTTTSCARRSAPHSDSQAEPIDAARCAPLRNQHARPIANLCCQRTTKDAGAF